jgi:hypothetical protein
VLDTCSNCGEPLSGRGTCLNANCKYAHRQATRSAAMPKAKATAEAVRDTPRAFQVSGRPD